MFSSVYCAYFISTAIVLRVSEEKSDDTAPHPPPSVGILSKVCLPEDGD